MRRGRSQLITAGVWSLLLALGAGCGALKRFQGDEPEAKKPIVTAAVAVPITLPELRKLAAEQGSQLKQERSRGGGSACHGPVCLLFLPVVAMQLISPEHHLDVTVTARDGRVTHQGTYVEKTGELVRLWVDDAHGMRDIQRLELPAIDQVVIAEVNRVRAGADRNDPTAWEHSAIGEQIDLVPKYRAAARAANGPIMRAGVLREAMYTLRGEAGPLLREELGPNPAERDDVAAELISVTCQAVETAPELRAVLLSLADNLEGPLSAQKTLECAAAVDDKLDTPIRRAQLARLVTAYCNDPGDGREQSLPEKLTRRTNFVFEQQLALEVMWKFHRTPFAQAGAAAVAACKPEARQTEARYALGL